MATTITVQAGYQSLPTGWAAVNYAALTIHPDLTIQRRATVHLGLVIDTSGSMDGQIHGRFSQKKIDLVRDAAQRVVNQLNDGDYLTVVAFSDRVQVLVPNQQITRYRGDLLHAADSLQSSHSSLTNVRRMGDGIAAALAELRTVPDSGAVIRKIVVLTDGQTNDEDYCYQLAEQTEIPFMLGGIGDDYNGTLLNEMARSARGIAEYIDRAEMVQDFFGEVMATVEATVITNAELALTFSAGFQLLSIYEVAPELKSFDFAPVTPTNRRTQIALGDIQKEGLTLLIQYAYEGGAGFANEFQVASLDLRYDMPPQTGLAVQSDDFTVLLGDQTGFPPLDPLVKGYIDHAGLDVTQPPPLQSANPVISPPTIEEATTMTCSACGSAHSPTARFCPSCGMNLGGAHSVPSAPPALPSGPSYPTSAVAVAAPLPQGALLQGRYRIAHVLGAGSFGRVYLAEDLQDAGSYVAIKELLDAHHTTPEEKEEAISWFKREVATLLSLRHSCIPTIHAYWTAHRSAGPLYLAMDYIPGKTLEAVLRDAGGRASWSQVVAWGVALCDVLTYLHSQAPPYIFRDMKLQNVLLDDRTQRPVLIDFGIARQLAPAGGTAIGTWGYVPYEQIVGRAEPRSDVYALGATLHALLTGRQPDAEYTRLQRSGLNLEATLRALFPRADSLIPNVPRALADALERATAFDMAGRFSDAASMSAALAAVLGQPMSTSSQHVVISPPITPTQPQPASTPPLTSAPATPSPIVVAIKGAGQFTSIAAAIRHAAAGSRIEVRPGRYVGALVIDKPVEIVGTGRVEDTIIECADATTITVATETALLRNLTVRNWAGLNKSEFNALAILQGHVQVEGCHITADSLACVAVSRTAQPTLRTCRIHGGKQQGIVFVNSSGGTLEDCEVSGNGKEGVYITDDSTPTLHRCRIHGGGGQGIFIVERGSGTIDGCEIFESAGNGICVIANGTVVIEDCTVRESAATGVLCGSGSKAIIRRCKILNGKDRGLSLQSVAQAALEDCEVTGNGEIGVVVHTCSPTIQHCTVRDNARGGIIFAHSTGSMKECIFSGNIRGQLFIQDDSDPVVQQCTISDGQSVGVSIQSGSRGTLHGCDISRQSSSGIQVANAAPIIRSCTIRACDIGIDITNNAMGTIDHCDIVGNSRANVVISGSANPIIRHTAIRDGEGIGVYFADDAQGTLENCRIMAPCDTGVLCNTGSKPIIQGCKIHNSKGRGISLQSVAQATVEDCEIIGSGEIGLVIYACSPTIRHCTVRDGQAAGVVFEHHGHGRMEECIISGHAQAQVIIQEESNPALLKCTIHHGQFVGIGIVNRSQATLQDCKVTYHNAEGIRVSDATLTLRNCWVDACNIGIGFTQGGTGIVDGCDISHSNTANMVLNHNANPAIRGTTIRDSRNNGLYISGDALGSLETCQIIKNHEDGILIADSANPTIRSCQIADSGGFGVHVTDQGMGSIEDCILTQNVRGSWNIPRFGKTRRKNNKG